MKRLILAVSVLILAVAGGCGRNPGRSSPGVTYTQGSGPQFGDAKPHEWVGGHPYNHPVHGIDISRYQGDIDWGLVRGSGVSFAYIKATEGGDHADPSFQRYWREAGQARIPRGAYHYYYFCRSGAEQAAWFIRNVPRERGALPPVIDLEWTHNSRTCKHQPSYDELRREVASFMSILQRHYGQRPIIYTTVDFYRDMNMGQYREEFWLRSVAGHPRIVYPGQNWGFWQYTGTGLVPGISGRVDLNVFAGSASDWRQWLNTRMQ